MPIQFKEITRFPQNLSVKSCKIISENFFDNTFVPDIFKIEKIHENVQVVQLIFCKMDTIPRGLAKIFPNFSMLEIFGAHLKTITKEELEEYKHLKELCITNGNLELLPGNLLEGFKNLEIVSFNENKLKVIEPNIFNGLENLKFVDLRKNEKFEQCYSIYPEWKGNVTLDELKNNLKKSYSTKRVKKTNSFVSFFQLKIPLHPIMN